MTVQYLFLHLLNNDIIQFYRLRDERTNSLLGVLRQAVRLGVLIADRGVVVPAASLFEVPETQRVLSETLLYQRAGLVHLYSPTAELQAYAEKKEREYRDQAELFGRYEAANVSTIVGITANVPWLRRIERSASADITAAWNTNLHLGGAVDLAIRDTRVGTRHLTSREEDLFTSIPQRLEGRAFILQNVIKLLPLKLHPRNVSRLAMLNNESYVRSYIDEHDATIFTQMPIGDVSCGLDGLHPSGIPRTISFDTYYSGLGKLGIGKVILSFAKAADLFDLRSNIAFRWINRILLSEAAGGPAILEPAMRATNFRPQGERRWYDFRTTGHFLSDSVWRAHDALRSSIDAEWGGVLDFAVLPSSSGRAHLPKRRRGAIVPGAMLALPGGPVSKAKTVFLVHGRDEAAARWMRNFLRALGLAPLEWSQAVALTGSGAPYVLDIVKAGMDAAQATVVLFTPDEDVRLRAPLATTPDAEAGQQSRPNVWFEAGIAMGLFPNNTALVTIGPNRPASDLSGIHFVHLTQEPASLLELSNRLLVMRCEVMTTGADFLKTPATYTSA